MSDSVGPHRQQPTRLPCPWDSPGKNTGVGCHFLLQCMKVKSESVVAQLFLTLSDPTDCSLPGSCIHRILQARVLEWVTIAFSNLTSQILRKYFVSRYAAYLRIFKISHLELSGRRKSEIVFADVEKEFIAGNHHLITSADFLNKCFL